MSAAAAAILEGMPDPRDLRRLDTGGETVIFAGSAELFRFAADDAAMRHVAAAVLRQLKFPGKDVAAVLGLTAELRGDAAPAGAAGGDGGAGPPGGTAPGDRRGGVGPGAGVAGRRGAGRGDRAAAGGEPVHRAAAAGPGARAGPAAAGGAGTARTEPEPDRRTRTAGGRRSRRSRRPGGPAGPVPPGPVPPAGDGQRPAEPVTVRSRYAGAMLLHAFAARAGAGDDLPGRGRAGRGAAGRGAAGGGQRLLRARRGDHRAVQAPGRGRGRAAGRAVPAARGCGRCGPALAAIADRADPLELQRMFAAAMLAADPVTSGVYYVDDHFVPYTGAKPVGKGWNNKRGRAERGRADTHVTAHDGRAVCFVTGEPSGLSVTLPKALAELKKAAGPAARRSCSASTAAAPTRRSSRTAASRTCTGSPTGGRRWPSPPCSRSSPPPPSADKSRTITWAEEKVQLKDYGEARQLTLFEHGRVVLQILTSDFDACPADILSWLKSRWREENFLKYASENYGIDKICDYTAAIEVNTKIIANPARKAANAAVRDARKASSPPPSAPSPRCSPTRTPPPPPRTRRSPPPSARSAPRRRKLKDATAARDQIPAKLPADQIDPDARTAVLRAGRRGLQMVLRLLAHNAEHWLANHLNAYLRDDDEYRAITRETIIRGLAGTITFTPAAITVTLQPPGEPRVARALTLLTDEINTQPPAIPGDTRPITYRIHPPAI